MVALNILSFSPHHARVVCKSIAVLSGEMCVALWPTFPAHKSVWSGEAHHLSQYGDIDIFTVRVP